jgi:hypothetical protein
MRILAAMTVDSTHWRRRRGRQYERGARRARYANAWNRFAYGHDLRLPPRLRFRARPTVVIFAVPLLLGLIAGSIYWLLDQVGPSPLALGAGVTLGLWLMAAAGPLLGRFRRAGSRPLHPPGSSGGGSSGVREPRRPPSNPQELSAELRKPDGGDS